MGQYEVQVSESFILVLGYYVDTVGKNTKAITEYIRHLLGLTIRPPPFPIYDDNIVIQIFKKVKIICNL